MFGYVIPLARELKVKEFERFRACYCGLCHTLRRRYGLAARFILNYDFTFLAMLMWDAGEDVRYELKRCVASPFCKRCVCAKNASYELSAAYSVILAYWKLLDQAKDEKFPKSLTARAAMLLLRSAYNKAKNEHPDFDTEVSRLISELDALERSATASLDEPADKFASILAYAAESAAEENRRRILHQLLYHTGRFVYITDAANDVKEDAKAKRYNAVSARFRLDGTVTEQAREDIKKTLDGSLAYMATAFELLPKNKWTEITGNIIYFGMPEVSEQVLAGTFRKSKHRYPKQYKFTDKTGEIYE